MDDMTFSLGPLEEQSGLTDFQHQMFYSVLGELIEEPWGTYSASCLMGGRVDILDNSAFSTEIDEFIIWQDSDRLDLDEQT